MSNKIKYTLWLNTDRDHCLGSFNDVNGFERNFNINEGESIITFSDGFIAKNFIENNSIGECDLYIEFIDSNNNIMTVVEGVASQVNLNKNHKELEIISDVRSSLFLRQGALNLWQERCNGLPKKNNSWFHLNDHDRETWLEISLFDKRKRQFNCSNEVELNGKIINSLMSFLCAFGESLEGPGGYIGRGLTSLEDCLNSLTFDIILPENLIWKNSDISKKGFKKNNEMKNFQEMMFILSNVNINVILE